MQESLSPEHSCELLAHSLEEFLDSCAVSNEGGAHLETSWWDVADGCLHIVGDPFNEVGGVLVLDVQHLFIDFLHGHAATEHSGYGKVTTMSWITGGHHVLGVEHLLGQFWDGQGTVLLASTYDFTNIKSDLYLFVGSNDWLATQEDNLQFISKFMQKHPRNSDAANNSQKLETIWSDNDHLDFIWS